MPEIPRLGKTLDLFGSEGESDVTQVLEWPEQDLFPLNVGSHRVENIVLRDLEISVSPLVVTGFTSLDRILDFCSATLRLNPTCCPRLLFGQEPFASRKESFSLKDADTADEIEAYWLKRGISLVYSAQLIEVIELLQTDKVTARCMKGRTRLHAKMYVGDHAVSLGSSNFTDPGMTFQLEVNARFERTKQGARFSDAKSIAENYWSMGRCYKQDLIKLLEQLLKVVTWQEALARACAELLEGEWAEQYIRGDYLSGSGGLWPSQKQGIAQALTILASQGSVLVADATGAGKTKMGAYLIGAVQDQSVRAGRVRKGKALLVGPPGATDNWMRESTKSGVAIDVYSHGLFSSSRSSSHENTMDTLRRAQVLCIDEGHNFLNAKSKRTQSLLRNMADHVLLFTATPINKSAHDLLRIADMLGADNLSDSVVSAFQRMLGSGKTNRNLDESEINALRAEIKRFTVRRTKKQLNRLIDAAPENYTDFVGRQCRFPKHQAKVYSLQESATDRKIAAQITELSEQLNGVTHFIKAVRMPDQFIRQGVSEEAFLKGRLLSAKKLVAYTIRAALRSSRAALIEHIYGTDSAVDFAGLVDFNKGQKSEGMLARIVSLKGVLPENRLTIPLPDWLANSTAHSMACDHDEQIYRQIADLTEKMSDQRENSKVSKLTELLQEHNLVLAFDRSPITLAMLAQRLQKQNTVKVLTAWGGGSSDRNKILDSFVLGSEVKGVVGLCSDSLAEAVNLQQASCLVHLDMPSVVRVAEQRVGRIDRMDSPHREIEIWWPDDSPEFALRADEKFIERYETVERLLGANMPLPENMLSSNKQVVSVQSMIKEAESVEVEWDGIVDAFAPVRELIEGAGALVTAADYAHYAHVTQRIMSRVSLVKSRSPWALFCLTTGTFGAPVWVYLGPSNAAPETGFEKIAEKLRKRLGELVADVPMDKHGAKVLEHFLRRLSECERQLLSRKKQKALTEMEAILQKLVQTTSVQYEIDPLLKLLQVLQNPERDIQPDWDEIALRWLDLIRPVWFEQLSQKRNRPLLLKDIRSTLLRNPQPLITAIISQFGTLPILAPAHERIKACIIGL